MKYAALFAFSILLGARPVPAQTLRTVQTPTPQGVLEGVVSADNKVRTFKGIPYAAPPVGPLRWKAPEPARPWTGVRKAVDYGPRCMQNPIYNDMVFHDAGPSEDCLYLNLWMPEAPYATQAADRIKLPVMFWIHGGGFAAGATSEPRQDAGNLSKQGVLVVSLNYRLGIFGFFAHPELAAESSRKASGNYGLLDQVAALRWVRDNIAYFGGDPRNVTIFGESAGSFSVSALMASPLADGLFRRAIGESGAFFGSTLPLRPRAEAERTDSRFAEAAFGTLAIEKLRAIPAADILSAVSKQQATRFSPDIDGYFLPDGVAAIFAAGKQNRVPLLAGWNADEGGARSFLGNVPATPASFAARAKARFGDRAAEFLKLYPAADEAQAQRSAADMAGDDFIAFGTWKWLEAHAKTAGVPIYRYRFEQPLPLPRPASPHAGEIEYVFQVLSSRKLPWSPEDRQVSDLMASYWTNFAKNGDPNGPALPPWPRYAARDGYPVMHLSAAPKAAPDDLRARYEFLDRTTP